MLEMGAVRNSLSPCSGRRGTGGGRGRGDWGVLTRRHCVTRYVCRVFARPVVSRGYEGENIYREVDRRWRVQRDNEVPEYEGIRVFAKSISCFHLIVGRMSKEDSTPTQMCTAYSVLRRSLWRNKKEGRSFHLRGHSRLCYGMGSLIPSHVAMLPQSASTGVVRHLYQGILFWDRREVPLVGRAT